VEPGTHPRPVGPLRIDQARREATVDGKEVRLTPIEYRLLVFLAAHAGKVESDPARPRLLLTEAGVGYRMRD
jgi:two-component system KDP operon response regulator KdpE